MMPAQQLGDGLVLVLVFTMGTIGLLGLSGIGYAGWQFAARCLGKVFNKPAWGREKLTVRR